MVLCHLSVAKPLNQHFVQAFEFALFSIRSVQAHL